MEAESELGDLESWLKKSATRLDQWRRAGSRTGSPPSAAYPSAALRSCQCGKTLKREFGASDRPHRTRVACDDSVGRDQCDLLDQGCVTRMRSNGSW